MCYNRFFFAYQFLALSKIHQAAIHIEQNKINNNLTKIEVIMEIQVAF